MSMSIQGSAPKPAAPMSYADAMTRGAAVTAKSPEASSAETDFLKFAKMTPAERLHAQMLAKLGLTEEEFEKMDPKARAEVADKILNEIKKTLEANGDKRPGMITDIKA
ncbi:hypothetical protein DWF00_13315 [Bosea caraganae]|uniref:Uncharacterized protein n=1 Tax=Bosea caraganae TaxID=2763117 RepID=A0A370L1A3_9HYPH|nr:hypothetical protein [Bosea caraganae]RDJ21294.1 hypothetical protein DWE98_21480 [Bosea caraganae]RDJ26434.1 hypothetical protein DWF00_13315 [Bosea caraganae]